MLYDVFISHASEDKDTFVRPLAERLKQENLEVWYDEFSLGLGDRVRQSIDLGLSQSRFGIIVLSPAFFSKSWPQYELDGLAQIEMKGRDQILLPIWHGVTHQDVLAYSAPLAGRKAASSDRGLDSVVDAILRVVRPQGSPLIAARDVLIDWGLAPPVITDPFWLDVVEASNRVSAFGAAIPEESAWDRWSFPLPPRSSDARDRGERLAWTAMQMKWTRAAVENRITVLTHPDEVHQFIREHAGLWETCATYPDLVAEYAPQLAIRGFEGDLLEAIEEGYEKSRLPRANSYGEAAWLLRSQSMEDRDASDVAGAYFSGGIFGPSVSPYEHADHLFWLLSDSSCWLPEPIRRVLTRGMAEWNVWLWHGLTRELKGREWPECGSLADCLHLALEQGSNAVRLTEQAMVDLTRRIELSAELLGLVDSPDAIRRRFIDEDFPAQFLQAHERIKRRRKGPFESP